MSNQPQLPEEALLALLKAAREGDQSASEQLLAQYAPLIDSMAVGFCREGLSAQDREDLRQEATLGFYQALKKYNPDKEASFGYFAKVCIHNRLVSHLRSLKHVGHVVSLDEEPLPTDREFSSDPAQILVEQEKYSALCKQVCELLSEYENRVWWLYLAGRTAKDVALLLGSDEKSVQNAIYRIRKKLRSGLPYS